MQSMLVLAAAGTVLASLATAAPAHAQATSVKNVVLVHGAWADGSGWRGVYDILKKDGYNVSIVQNPLSSLADDVAATKRVLAMQTGPVILVGHSYGGAVVSEAGNDPNVVGLVYIAAFILNDGESIDALSKNPAPGSPVPPLLPPQDGYLFLDKAKFAAAFAADLKPADAAFLANSQTPWGLGAFAGTITKAAWKSKPSWALIPTEDLMIGAGAERFMAMRAGATIVEFPGASHAVYISQPKAVADLIEKAATTAKAVAK